MRHRSNSARALGSRAARHLAAVVFLVTTACASAAQVDTAPTASPAISSQLALLTFDSAWSRIAHTHYDTAFNGVDWNGVKAELRPRAAAATTLNELRGVISNMLARLGESHYGLIPREAATAVGETGASAAPSHGDIGVELRLVDDVILVWRVDPNGPGAAAGVRTGWRVVAIDGTPTQPRIDALAALPQAQQRVARTRMLYQVNNLLHGDPGSAVVLSVDGGRGRTEERRVVRRPQPGELVRFANLPPFMAELRHERIATPRGCVGMIRLNGWFTAIGPAFDRAVDTMRDCQGIIIDLRGNPGGMAGMVMGTAGHFLRDTVPLGFMRMRASATAVNVLRFKANPRRSRADGTAVEPYSGPVAILTDEMSASTSEFFAAGLQAVGRARVFGRNSAGQALPAMLVRLPTDDVLMHVMADFTGPGGIRIEGRGVQPDVPVADTRADLLEQRDAPLRAALEWIASSNRTGEQLSGGKK